MKTRDLTVYSDTSKKEFCFHFFLLFEVFGIVRISEAFIFLSIVQATVHLTLAKSLGSDPLWSKLGEVVHLS